MSFCFVYGEDVNLEKLKKIMIADKMFPIKIDLNVLERIQETYGTIHEFERQILGLKVARDSEEKIIYTKDKKPLLISVEPSVKAINTVLPLMINEGLAIEAEETGRG